MTMGHNFIGGEWVAGARSVRNINPSDTRDVIGEYAQADAAQQRVEAERIGHRPGLRALPRHR